MFDAQCKPRPVVHREWKQPALWHEMTVFLFHVYIRWFCLLYALIRYTLAKAGWYGDPQADLSFLFTKAHTDFRAWAREKKIYSVQRNLRYGLEPLFW